MKQIEYFRTYSYGGEDGRELEIRNFETPELAKDDAISDMKNTHFSLYQISILFNGRITESKKYLGQIVCGRDLQEFAEREKIRMI
ncbi:MAG: hypothetical protein IJE04_03915 [Bacilli bacterium]|nr:hypothetical protein [Bacilli bacterium]